jgi:hypothetical protein
MSPMCCLIVSIIYRVNLVGDGSMDLTAQFAKLIIGIYLRRIPTANSQTNFERIGLHKWLAMFEPIEIFSSGHRIRLVGRANRLNAKWVCRHFFCVFNPNIDLECLYSSMLP